MTNINQKIAELETQLAALKAEVNKHAKWPQVGDEYHVICNTGTILTYGYDEDDFDELSLSQGNVFRTQAQAERERDRRALIAELRKEANYYVPVWGGVTLNYNLMWSNDSGWQWDNRIHSDVTPRSGYFAKPIDDLIERYGDRLNLLKDIEV